MKNCPKFPDGKCRDTGNPDTCGYYEEIKDGQTIRYCGYPEPERVG
jgi:hypothetical protein